MPTLVYMPCGCIVDLFVYVRHGYTPVFECYWCGSTFRGEDLARWFRQKSRKVVMSIYRPILSTKDNLFEAIGQCGECAGIMLRPRGDRFETCHMKSLAQVRPLVN